MAAMRRVSAHTNGTALTCFCFCPTPGVYGIGILVPRSISYRIPVRERAVSEMDELRPVGHAPPCMNLIQLPCPPPCTHDDKCPGGVCWVRYGAGARLNEKSPGRAESPEYAALALSRAAGGRGLMHALVQQMQSSGTTSLARR
jgi:hypothetical protein